VYIFLAGQEGSEICLKNFAASTEEEYYNATDPLSYAGGAKAKKQQTATDGTGETALAAGYLSTVWNDEDGAFSIYKYSTTDIAMDCLRFSVNGYDGDLPSVDYFMQKLANSKTADGKAYVKMQLKVDEKFLTGDATTKSIAIHVRSFSANALMDGSSYVKPIDLGMEADTWTTVYFDVTKLLAYYEADDLGYFQISVWGVKGSKISFRELQVATQAEYNAFVGNN
jgi:hypothetical protein